MQQSSSSCSSTSTRRTMKTNNNNNNKPVIFLFVLYSCIITFAAAFSPPAPFSSSLTLLGCTSSSSSSLRLRSKVISTSSPPRSTTTVLYNSSDDDDDDDDDVDLENYDPNVAAQIRKARKLLRDAKKKMMEDEQQQQQQSSSSSPLPFFAQQQKSFTATAIDQTRKIKSKTKSGEIIADGDTMTSLSNSEPWERRSLSDIGFQTEARTDFDGNVVQVVNNDDGNDNLKNGLAERDLVASIYNLRKALRNEDFTKVFDSRNRFIGEVD